MLLNSLERIITSTMANIRLDRDSNLVPPGYKCQSIRMSHQGWPEEEYARRKAKRVPRLRPEGGEACAEEEHENAGRKDGHKVE